ncbi:MAG TPA: ATP-binding cassette domain-containing protein [Thermoanaerobaculia bacterium]|nr:ATP-binding cassette domain-containing protein [Thermoanaerobaculia bacterium]
MSIVIEQLTKRYAGHPVVNAVSLTVGDGQLYVLLGPSGSGKSTLLRMIAGLSDIDAGRVLLHGREVTDLPPAGRDVGFVFQSYALFRGMTVAENVEFALRIRGAGKAERRRRRDELLELVGLTGLGGRMPRQLSGGQQQRVALARALAHQPQVLLLDEPFGALDARVRLELRRTVRAIQHELGVTTLFVTHDQEEAFELADRVAVLNFGRLLEEGPPEELYLRPQTEFVATFLGTANLMVGERIGDEVCLGPVCFPLGTRGQAARESHRVQVLFRPEDVALRESAEALSCPPLGRAVVDQRAFVGSFERLRLRLPPLPGVRPIAPAVPFGSEEILVEATRSQNEARRYPLQTGEVAWVGVRRVHALEHPGLHLVIVVDPSAPSRAALALGSELARLANARVTVLGHGARDEKVETLLQEARERLGSGLAAVEARAVPGPPDQAVAEQEARQPADLVVVGRPQRDGGELAERLLSDGCRHLLLVPGEVAEGLERVLICVAVGEPGKEDVSFAGRLARHLGAETTILTVLDPAHRGRAEAGAQRFLARCARTMARLEVPVATRIRYGAAREQILAELAEGRHGLLVIGAPLPASDGRIALGGLVGRLLREADRPVLLVRSSEATA